MKRNRNLLAAAFALTAVAYGLARFAFGLLLPQIRADLSLDIASTGWIGSSAFVAYCVGVLAAFLCAHLLSTRMIAFGAGLCCSIGMVIVLGADSGLTLGIGIALSGLGTGLTSPPLASAVALRFDEPGRPRANAMINAGTAAGIVLSGVASLMAVGQWRALYATFALIGCAVTTWIFFALPASRERGSAERLSLSGLMRPPMPALCSGAFLMGASSTAIWTFGGNILRDTFKVSETTVGWIWVALGLAGVIGAASGVLTQRFGVLRVHRIALVGMALGIAGLAATPIALASAFASAALFGAAYITSSATYLLQAIALLPGRPDLGIGIAFLLIAVGQSSGAPLFGALLEHGGVIVALGVFSGVALLAALISRQPPGRCRAPEEHRHG